MFFVFFDFFFSLNHPKKFKNIIKNSYEAKWAIGMSLPLLFAIGVAVLTGGYVFFL
jgi:hypothetical protein